MSPIAPVDQTTIEAHLAVADIPAVFDILQRYSDLRHTDLPQVSKAALKTLSNQPEAVRQMVLGFASLSPSVRRFCKKYYPKLGKPAAAQLLYLLAESLDPLRPIAQTEEGLLGDFGGYASPLGQAIRAARMSTKVRRPDIEVYSDAARFAREVLEPLPAALAATDFDTFLLGFEYYYGLGIFYSVTPKEYRTPFTPESLEVLVCFSYVISDKFKEILRSRAQKADATLLEAMHTWIDGKTLLESQTWQGTPIEALQNRFLHHCRREIVSQNLQGAAADHFVFFPQEQRVSLYRLIQQCADIWDNRTQVLLEYSLRDYRRRYPEEAEQADQATTPIAPVTPPQISPQPTATLQSTDTFAVDREDALNYLFAIAEYLNLHGVARDLFFKDLEFGGPDDFPPASSNPAVQKDEHLVQEIRQWIKKQESQIPLIAWQQSNYTQPLFDLLERAVTGYLDQCQQVKHQTNPDDQDKVEWCYWRGIRLMSAALAFLPDPLFQQWLAIWHDRVLPLHSIGSRGFRTQDDLPQLINARFPEAAPFLLLSLQTEVEYPNADDHWQLQLAKVYAKRDDRSRQTMRQELARVALNSNAHYRRHDWHPPYLWLITQWWENQDSELLALACDRCAIPMYWKGEKAYSPVVKSYPVRENYAPLTYQSSDGAIPVQDICKIVAEKHPEFLSGIVQNNFQMAGEERAACTLLTCFASIVQDSAPFQACLIDLVDLLASPQTYAIVTGLELLTLHPELAEEVKAEILLAVDRALAGTATGVAKQAVACLGQLAITHPDIQEQTLNRLENALDHETPSVLEETLKTWKKVLARVKNATLSGPMRDRLQELATQDPKRYNKSVQHLLQRDG